MDQPREPQLFTAIRTYHATKTPETMNAILEEVNASSLLEIYNQYTAMELIINLKLWDVAIQIATRVPSSEEKIQDSFGQALLDALKANTPDSNNAAKALLKANAHLGWYILSTRSYALHIAVHNQDISMITLLLSHGASLYFMNVEKQTPIELAAHLGYWELVELIASQEKTNTIDKAHYGQTALKAENAGREDIVKVLVTAGAAKPIKTKAREKYQLLQDHAVMMNIMPAFLLDMLNNFMDILREDLVSLQQQRSDTKDPECIGSLNILIQSINQFIHFPDKLMIMERIEDLAKKGFPEACNIKTYLDRRNEVLDYANRLKLVLSKLGNQIEFIDWQVAGWFGLKNEMPPKIIEINQCFQQLKSVQSFMEFLKISMKIRKLSSMLPEEKPENLNIIEFFNTISKQMDNIPFENPFRKTVLVTKSIFTIPEQDTISENSLFILR